MQGINKAKHVHLIDALLQLEKVLDSGAVEDLAESKIYRRELAIMFQSYELLLGGLAIHIAEYEELFQQARIQFLARKIKAMKKLNSQNEHTKDGKTAAFSSLVKHMPLSYGT